MCEYGQSWRSVNVILVWLHCYGLKKLEETPDRKYFCFDDNALRGINFHWRLVWRECRMDNMIHLTDDNKLKIGKMLCRYFAGIYGIADHRDMIRQEIEMEEEMESNRKTMERSMPRMAEMEAEREL